jgi:hypothetical protein
MTLRESRSAFWNSTSGWATIHPECHFSVSALSLVGRVPFMIRSPSLQQKGSVQRKVPSHVADWVL